jgi:hypothetical protein
LHRTAKEGTKYFKEERIDEKETGSGNSRTDSVNSGSESYYQIHTPLGWSPW